MPISRIISFILMAAIISSCQQDIHFNLSECKLSDLRIETGECTGEGTYKLHINFTHHNTGSELFNVYVRDNILVGTYKLADLPITIKDFKKSGKDYDYIKIVLKGREDCFLVKEFESPKCHDATNTTCTIKDLKTDVGHCTSKETYDLKINFTHHNTGSELFNVYVRDHKLVGIYKLADLPITIKDFKKSGKDYDYIKIVLKGREDCFLVKEFESPKCHDATNTSCTIKDLKTDIGHCTSKETYDLKINFTHHNTGSELFNVYVRDHKLVGTYRLADLPLTIKDFKKSGKDYDYIKIVLKGREDCFLVKEFESPKCHDATNTTCTIKDLKTDIGHCTSKETYDLKINFTHHNTGSELFNVYVRDHKLVGTYKLADLPITIKDFKKSGKDYDYVKIVLKGREDCFLVKEFESPKCHDATNTSCTIKDLKTDIGHCTTDSTYNLRINFMYQNAGNAYFDVFTRNNQRIGTYRLADLPLTIKDFKKSGKDYDYIKIAINDRTDCYVVHEFKSPTCR